MDDAVRIGPFTIHPTTGEVRAAGRSVELGEIERRLLVALVRRAPDAVARDALIAEMWPEGLPPGSRALDMAWSRLRRRLDDHASLRTVRGVGYAIQRDGAPIVGDLPASVSRFVGFERELGAVLARLQGDCRWLTITGLGGVGKTRLALEVARRSQGAATRWVELAPVSHDDAALRHVAAALGLELAPGADVDSAITSAYRQRRALVCLDNLEHLSDAAPRLAAAFAPCRAVQVIATSRRLLGVPGEVVQLLEGLAEAAPAFYFDRLHATLVPADPAALEPSFVNRVCEATAGHPLTIELAVAALRRGPPESLSALLSRSPAALRGERVGRVERHASFEVIFEDSWAALDGELRAALASLSLFAGPFLPSDAEALVGVGADLIGALRARSLVRTDDAGTSSLHPLIREVAAARLPQVDPAQRARVRYRSSSLAWLGGVVEGLRADDPTTVRAVQRRMPDLAAAWTDAVKAEDRGALLQAWPGARAWFILRDEARLAVRWCEQAAPLFDGQDVGCDLAVVRAGALVTLARAAEARAALEPGPRSDAPPPLAALHWAALARARAAAGDFDGTVEALRSALALAGAVEEVELEVRLATVAAYSLAGRTDLGEDDAVQAESLARKLSNRPLLRRALAARASRLLAKSRFAEGVAAAAEAVRLAEQVGDRGGAFAAGVSLAMGTRFLGHAEEALGMFEALQREVPAVGMVHRLPYLIQQEAAVRMDLGQLDAADEVMRRALAAAERQGQALDQANTLMQLANLLAVRGRFDDAIEIMGRRRRVTEAAGLSDPYNQMLNALGMVPPSLLAGRNDIARREVAAARALAREHGLAESVWWQTSLCYALVEANDGDAPAAARYALEALERASSPWFEYRSLFLLALAMVRLGHVDVATGLLPSLRDGASCSEKQAFLPALEAALADAGAAPSATGGDPRAALVARLRTIAQVLQT